MLLHIPVGDMLYMPAKVNHDTKGGEFLGVKWKHEQGNVPPPPREEMSAALGATYDRLMETYTSSLDWKLYKAVDKKLNKTIANLGPSFQERLALYRKLQA